MLHTHFKSKVSMKCQYKQKNTKFQVNRNPERHIAPGRKVPQNSEPTTEHGIPALLFLSSRLVAVAINLHMSP